MVKDVADVAKRHLLAEIDARARNCRACRAPRCGGLPCGPKTACPDR